MHWQVKPWDKSVSMSLAQALDMPVQVAALLFQRGISTPEQAKKFLFPALDQLPQPLTMKGMEEAVAILSDALVRDLPIFIYGDYDADGLTAVAVLARFFKETGALRIHCHVPSRFRDGYGLHRHAIDEFAVSVGNRSEKGVIVTVDCGISNHQEVEWAKIQGFRVIVTDHHQPPAQLPAADAILNPHQPGCGFPFKGLAGVGVAFYLVMGLRQHLSSQGYWQNKSAPNLKKFMDMVAIGTVADVAPLVGPNRIIVKAGLDVMTSSAWPGVRAVLNCARIAGKKLQASDIAFQLAPRINAPGRIDDPGKVLQLLMTDDEVEAGQLSDIIEKDNVKRKAFSGELYEHIVCQAAELKNMGRKSIVLVGREWHRGILGQVASQIAKECNLPTILLSLTDEGMAKGSGRSVPGCNLHEILSECAKLMNRFGGHEQAAGMEMPEASLSDFKQLFEVKASEALAGRSMVSELLVDWQFDGEKELLGSDVLAWLQQIEPYGEGNPEPVFMMRGTVKSLRMVGDGHVKFEWLTENERLNGIFFNRKDLLDVDLGESVSLAFSLQQNFFGSAAGRWELMGRDILIDSL